MAMSTARIHTQVSQQGTIEQIKEVEIKALKEIENEWKAACEKLSVPDVEKLLVRIHAIPNGLVEQFDYSIKYSHPRRLLYRFGITCAILADRVDLLALIWKDYENYAMKNYTFVWGAN